MFGYATEVRSMTSVRATDAMEFSHDAEMPGNLAEAVGQKAASRGIAHGRGPEKITDYLGCHDAELTGGDSGEEEVRADQAPPERRDHRSHRPWQDDADGCHHEGAVREGPGPVHTV